MGNWQDFWECNRRTNRADGDPCFGCRKRLLLRSEDGLIVMGRTNAKYEHAYAIVLVEGPNVVGKDVEVHVTVKEVVRDLSIAKSEVERLNRLESSRVCAYFWQTTRVYAEGESLATDAEEAPPSEDRTT